MIPAHSTESTNKLLYNVSLEQIPKSEYVHYPSLSVLLPQSESQTVVIANAYVRLRRRRQTTNKYLYEDI